MHGPLVNRRVVYATRWLDPTEVVSNVVLVWGSLYLGLVPEGFAVATLSSFPEAVARKVGFRYVTTGPRY
jgi:hypothetical protein